MKIKKAFFALCLLALSGCDSCKQTSIAPNPNLDPQLEAMSSKNKGEDPLSTEQWTTEKLMLAPVWERIQGSHRVTVAVLSTGVDYNHEDLRPNIYVNMTEIGIKSPGVQDPLDRVDNDQNGFVDDLVGYDFVEDDGLPYDRNGLGTAAAGIIGGVHNNGVGLKGVVPEVSVIPVRYIDTNGRSNIPLLVRAFIYCKTVKPDVIFLHLPNIEFGSPEAKPEQIAQEKLAVIEALKSLVALRIPLVISAGNTGENLGQTRELIKILKQNPFAIFVTSVDRNDQRPFIANFGMQIVGTAAPGEDVLTTVPGNRYENVSGTFAAAAFVAGAIALGVSEHFGELPNQIYLDALLSHEGSDPLPDMELETIGGNRLNVAKFLAVLGAR